MARVKISEYRAKKILLGEEYKGVQMHAGSLKIPAGKWVAKVDQGVKKRMKQGLVSIGKPQKEMLASLHGWEKLGFTQFLLEPLFPHEESEEQYVSFERVRDGIRVLYASDGGVDIEKHPEVVQTFILKSSNDAELLAKKISLPASFLTTVREAFTKHHFTFLEINPLVVRGSEVYLLDAAVLVDSSSAFFVRDSWTEDDVIQSKAKHAAEARVEELASTTPSSLKLSVINPNGSIFLLLSGGGGSIVIADEAQMRGAGNRIANYGEYSGGPTREETYLYAKEVIRLMQDSPAKKKALVIAGGVANFTDVRTTFLGIIDALSESANKLKKSGVRVFVRRGGPNEAAGLALMKDFLEKEDLHGSVHGSSEVITSAVSDAIAYTDI